MMIPTVSHGFKVVQDFVHPQYDCQGKLWAHQVMFETKLIVTGALAHGTC